MSGSTVPAVLNALRSLVATATGSTVIFGEPQQGQTGDFIAIAHNDQTEGVTNTQSLTDYALRASTEEYDVNSVISCWQGDADMLATFTRAYNLLDEIDAALIGDPRLGETCMLAQRTQSGLRPLQTTSGAMTVLAFTVHVQAQRT